MTILFTARTPCPNDTLPLLAVMDTSVLKPSNGALRTCVRPLILISVADISIDPSAVVSHAVPVIVPEEVNDRSLCDWIVAVRAKSPPTVKSTGPPELI